jgi:ADP-ribose pyrophosphatase
MRSAGKAKTTHIGNVFSVQVLSWTDESGRAIRRDIVRDSGAVLIVPVLDDGRLVMIRNQRVAVAREKGSDPFSHLEEGKSIAALLVWLRQTRGQDRGQA